jgi:hypothetical protein
MIKELFNFNRYKGGAYMLIKVNQYKQLSSKAVEAVEVSYTLAMGGKVCRLDTISGKEYEVELTEVEYKQLLSEL